MNQRIRRNFPAEIIKDSPISFFLRNRAAAFAGILKLLGILPAPHIHSVIPNRDRRLYEVRNSPVFSGTNDFPFRINTGKPCAVPQHHVNSYLFCRTGNPFPDPIFSLLVKDLSFGKPSRRLRLPFHQYMPYTSRRNPEPCFPVRRKGSMKNHMTAAVRNMPVSRPEKAPFLSVKILAHAVINLKIPRIPYPICHFHPFLPDNR